jgi:coenzyme F420-reducing hydrogenase delta subunit
MFTFHLNAIDIDDLDKLFVAIGGLKSEEKVFLKGKTQGECIFGIGNETRIKMRFDYTDGLIKDMINKDMSEFKNKLKTMKGGE